MARRRIVLKVVTNDERMPVPREIARCPDCGGRLRVELYDWIQFFTGVDFYVPGDNFGLFCESEECMAALRSTGPCDETFSTVGQWLRSQNIVAEMGPDSHGERV